jgi:transcriptional regulator with XRE-family HTH domain
MLRLFIQIDNAIYEVNVSASLPHERNPDLPPYRLVSAERLRMAMERTGTGQDISTRELALKAGISAGSVSNLCNGVRKDVPCEVAHAICAAVGVDLLFLFQPTGRAVKAEAEDEDTSSGSEAVSA